MSLADHICSPLSSELLISAIPVCTPNNEAESPEQEHKTPSADLRNLESDSVRQSEYLPLQDPAIQGISALDAPQKSVGYLRPGKNVPPRIDAFAASTYYNLPVPLLLVS